MAMDVDVGLRTSPLRPTTVRTPGGSDGSALLKALRRRRHRLRPSASAVPPPAAASGDVNMNIASPRSNAVPLPALPPCAYATDEPSV